MFTLEQIQTAHNKVHSGANFPNYIKDIKKLGVLSYTVSVADGHTEFFGANGYALATTEKYEPLEISPSINKNQFLIDIKAHQQGKTDYMTFCRDCAKSGIDRWVMDLESMTCTYFDIQGGEILAENIPQ